MPPLLPLARSGDSTSLVSAPLEWNTVLPRQSWVRASFAATAAIASSGTVIHTSPLFQRRLSECNDLCFDQPS